MRGSNAQKREIKRVFWNDYCSLKVAVTVDGAITYYAVVGSLVDWDVTVDEDNEIVVSTTDENFIVLDTANGTDITVDITGDEWSIEVISLSWDNAPDTAFADASFTLIAESESEEETALMTKVGNTSDAEIYVIDFTGLTEEQVDQIAYIEAFITVDTGYVNGAIGGTVDGDWTGENFELYTAEAADVTSARFTLDGSLVLYDEEGNLSPHAEVQFWYVNPEYDEEGNEIGEGTAALTAVYLCDSKGNIVLSYGGSDDGSETEVETEVLL